ncbi:MAG: response regulator transcription factor [Phycisphaerae bacterium]|nr:response regulator transcription factor [Phycisphaerae bacterium]
MEAEATVFVVDDDPGVRKGLSMLIKSVGLNVEAYPGAQAFLDACEPTRPGCLVLDVRMPGMSGLELQEKLAAQQITLPVIILTGHADVPMAVRAMQAGAIDFIEKPFREQVLLDRIQQAIEQDRAKRREQVERIGIKARLDRLTPREREVLDLVVAGKHNKATAAELGVSPKTVEFHRSRIMDKLKANSVADLVRMTLLARDER